MLDSLGNSISVQLGYQDDLLEPAIGLSRENLVLSLMEQLNTLDTAIAEATLDSMAVSVGDLKVDYQGHLKTLKRQGSDLLKTLSNLVGIPVYYDRFLGKQVYQVIPSSPYSVQSYW